MNQIRIILLDSQAITLEGIGMLLASNPEFHLAGQALNAARALQILEENETDIVIINSDNIYEFGIDTCIKIRFKYPNIHVVLLTDIVEKAHIRKAIFAGFSGYLLKNNSTEILFHTIKTVANGTSYFCNKVMSELVSETCDSPASPDLHYLSKVSSRELQVLKLIAQELSTTQIAERLFISHSTAESHRRNLIRKLGVKGSVGLALFAFRNKII